MFISGFAEMISFTAVIPFLSVLTEPERYFGMQKFEFLYRLFNIQSSSELLIPISVLFISLAIFAAIIKLTTIWISGKYAAALGSEISIKSFSNSLMQPYSLHIQKNTSSTISTNTTYINATVLVIHQTLWLISNALIAILILIGLFAIDYRIALTLLAVFGSAYLFLMKKLKSRLMKNSELISLSNQKQIKYIQEGIGSIRDIILDKSYRSFIDKYKKIDINMRLKNADSIFIAIYPRNILEVVGIIFLVSIAIFMNLSNQFNLKDTLPLLGAFALGAQRLLPAMQQSYNSWAAVNAYSSEISNVLESLNQKIYVNLENGQYKIDQDKIKKFKNKIIVNSLEFKYKNDSNLILQNINLEINKGENIGIIGPTGCGKSTFIDILMGLLKPTNGEILVDGDNIHTKKFNEIWMKNISHVPQNIYLTDNSFSENIAFGISKYKIDLKRVKKCAEIARISSFIESKNAGYDALVGEGGINLSGGQKQRIGIARALYKGSDLMIFDEATSALDKKTEKAVIKSIKNFGEEKTIFIVTHNMSTLDFCDRIIKFEKGIMREI